MIIPGTAGFAAHAPALTVTGTPNNVVGAPVPLATKLLLLGVGMIALLGLAGFLLVRHRRRRLPAQQFTVTDLTTFRNAEARLCALVEGGRIGAAEELSDSMAHWLRHEIHHGRDSRPLWCAHRLEQLELDREQYTGRPVVV
ncbi:hypothetical protein [Amycolatopsis sp. WQ 127309]|uniref:hypothetical protein n=1 Tax=Amycolatopsis sp. WQ 127309 TaxID=2932773 RepID=UPI001FF620AB|nr:hypothetical protein [Amycolatopsis sp. WQ 127309]UOZ06977.1 hypothetical protein MUY22_01390 [Amycolatopsis sp. WQ 127309]